MKPLLAALALPLLLAACATPSAYAPPPSPFAETRISEDRFRVTFQGAGDPAAGGDHALMRAADLAVTQGFDWFVVENRYTETYGGRGGNGPVISLGGSSINFGGRSASTFGAGVGFRFGDFARPRAATTLEIRMGRGPKPLEAYDARDVLRTLGGRA